MKKCGGRESAADTTADPIKSVSYDEEERLKMKTRSRTWRGGLQDCGSSLLIAEIISERSRQRDRTSFVLIIRPPIIGTSAVILRRGPVRYVPKSPPDSTDLMD